MSEDKVSFASAAGKHGLTMDIAPQDGTHILAWCCHEADSYYDEQSMADGTLRLTLYAAHSEGMLHAQTGFHIVEWGGAFDDSTWECPGASLPDWWFVAGSEHEIAANPIVWWPLPPAPAVSPEHLDNSNVADEK